MNYRKSKQFAVSFLIAVSLFASSAAACYCAHHQAKAESEIPACHRQTHENKDHKDSAKIETPILIDAPCGCLMESAPKVFAKSENIKIAKQTPPRSDSVSPAIVEVLLIAAPEKPEFSAFLYFSDATYNIKSPRAPPRL